MEYSKIIKSSSVIIIVLIILFVSCDSLPVYKIGHSNYYLIADGRTYMGYRETADEEIMYLNVFMPHGDTAITEILWNDNEIYAVLSNNDKLVGVVFINNINEYHVPKTIKDISILNGKEHLKRKSINPNGHGWFGEL